MWSGANGRPLLVVERVGAGTWLRFASRWNPAWTELVEAPQFPAWLLGLVEDSAVPPSSSRGAQSDRRLVAGQSAPGRSVAPVAEDSAELPLASWLWLQAFVLAGSERWLALRRTT